MRWLPVGFLVSAIENKAVRRDDHSPHAHAPRSIMSYKDPCCSRRSKIRFVEHRKRRVSASLEPCMMCLAASSWAGIRRVIFACSRSAVDPAYFETSSSSAEIAQLLKSRMEIIAETSREKEVVNLILRWQAQHTQFQIRTNDLPAR